MTTTYYPYPSHTPVDTKPKPKAHDTCCRCPACRGLECAERPRFFAGQLLTEAELNSEQAYVIAKNRLHNRYLHGWGVVCGLDVVCACKGFVRVTTGYAIDPCGNDIIVCKDTDFDLIGAIEKCLASQKRRDDECAPWRDPNADCKETEEHWCVTIEYKETEGRPITPLRQESSCGCGGAKKASTSPSAGGCSCGGGCGDKPAPKPARTAGPACEPTRILEQFKLGVICQPAECADLHRPKRTVGRAILRHSGLAEIIAKSLDIPQRFPKKNEFFNLALRADADGTLIGAFMDVLDETSDFLGERLSVDDLRVFEQMWNLYISQRQFPIPEFIFHAEEAFRSGMAMEHPAPEVKPSASPEASPKAPSGTKETTGTKDPQVVETIVVTAQPDSLYTACCHFRKALTALYNANPHKVRCTAFDCPPCQHDDATTPNPNDPDPTTPPSTESFFCLIEALLAYLIDAICLQLLPPCPATPCDDRLILACVTVHDGKIVHICNFACRHYAGSFNSLAYWASLVPAASALKDLIRYLCCSPEALQVIVQWIAQKDS